MPVSSALAKQTQRLGALIRFRQASSVGSEQGAVLGFAITSLLDRTRQTNAALEAVLAQLVILEKIYQVPSTEAAAPTRTAVSIT